MCAYINTVKIGSVIKYGSFSPKIELSSFNLSKTLLLCQRYNLKDMDCTTFGENGNYKSKNKLLVNYGYIYATPYSMGPDGNDLWYSGGFSPIEIQQDGFENSSRPFWILQEHVTIIR